MSLPLKLIEVEKGASYGYVDKATGNKPQPGDCFYAAWMIDTESPESWARGPSRMWATAPRVIVLPTRQWWCIDQRAYRAPALYPDSIKTPEDHKGWENSGWAGDGWNVTGELPNISITPSILVEGYHGFVTNGVLSDSI